MIGFLTYHHFKWSYSIFPKENEQGYSKKYNVHMYLTDR